MNYDMEIRNFTFEGAPSETMEYMPRMRKMCRYMGFWPLDTDGKLYEHKERMVILISVYYIFGMWYKMISIAADPIYPSADKMNLLCMLATGTALLYSYGCTFYLRRKLMKVYEVLDQFDDFGVPPDGEIMNRRIDYLSVGFCCYSSIGTLGLLMVPYYEMNECKQYNEMQNATVLMCHFAAPVKYPLMDLSVGFLYYFHLVLQYMMALNLCVKGAAYFGIAIGSFEGVVMRLKHLILMLREVYGDDDFDAQRARLTQCIKYHIHILDMSAYLNEFLSPLSTPALMFYNVIIGIGLLADLNHPSLFSVWATNGWIIGVFIACAAGERLMTTSLAVAEAAYDTKWYTDTRFRKDIYLIILMSQRPIKMQCGSLGEFSLETFKKIMQGAYTYATMKTGLAK